MPCHQGINKHFLDAEALEGVMQDSQASNSIKRIPQDHEAVFDFGDNRIYLPRWLRGECAGQLVTVDAKLNSAATRGQVAFTLKAPKRFSFDAAHRIEDVCDTTKIDEHQANLAKK